MFQKVQAAEAYAVSEKACDLNDLSRITDYFQQAFELSSKAYGKNASPRLIFRIAISVIYYAGLIDGVRQERAKRRAA